MHPEEFGWFQGLCLVFGGSLLSGLFGTQVGRVKNLTKSRFPIQNASTCWPEVCFQQQETLIHIPEAGVNKRVHALDDGTFAKI